MQLDEIADRFAEERLRLQFNKAAFARLLSISTEGLRLIEAGQSEFKLSVLVHAAAVGVDVQYVITGVRSLNANAVIEKVGYGNTTVSGDVQSGVGVVHSGARVQIINSYTSKESRRSKGRDVQADPGGANISLAQRANLKSLVEEVVELELKHNPNQTKTARSVWASLNRHCGVTTYTLIRAQDYEKAERFLTLWRGKLEQNDRKSD